MGASDTCAKKQRVVRIPNSQYEFQKHLEHAHLVVAAVENVADLGG